MSERWKMNRIGFVNFWLYDDEDFELEDLEALRETIDDLIDRKNAREFDGDEETDDDLDSFVVSMQDFDKDEPKLEDSVIVDEEK